MIDGCNQTELAELDLSTEREAAYNQLIGEVVDIQAKDAPIFTLAFSKIDSRLYQR